MEENKDRLFDELYVLMNEQFRGRIIIEREKHKQRYHVRVFCRQTTRKEQEAAAKTVERYLRSKDVYRICSGVELIALTTEE